MGVLELIQQKAFLGKEFLTWLWFKSETGGGVNLKGGAIQAEILGPIVLDAQYGDARATGLKGESPATSPEARTALVEGKKLKKAKIRLKREDVEWVATLDGENFNLAGLAIPNPGRMPFEDMMALRTEMMLEFEHVIEGLMQAFLELRLDAKEWAKELARIQTWVREK
ncbi:MAG TPA: hypothetical protein PK847_12430 [Candidatus Sumerlaeota bacterium]|nr:hypothetical protein [Candidatus Sumerlaeota bacterium]